MDKKYKASGMVFGNLWGGGKGSYPSKEMKANTKKQLFHNIENALGNGDLDGGMGFQYLIGAVMRVETTEYTIKDNKKYHRNDYEIESFGNLTDGDHDFLLDCIEY